MNVYLTQAYRSRLADLILNGSGSSVLPTVAYFGNGSQGRGPAEAMYNQTQQATVTTQRNSDNEVSVTAMLPASDSASYFDEVGLYAGDTLVLHATFPAQAIGAGAEGAFEFIFNPKVGS